MKEKASGHHYFTNFYLPSPFYLISKPSISTTTPIPSYSTFSKLFLQTTSISPSALLTFLSTSLSFSFLLLGSLLSHRGALYTTTNTLELTGLFTTLEKFCHQT
ncbi:uncharacterized protein BDW43DRAFT_239011 [Aspergillus alliaceus]|uniref:uncharacterized protein n=1 Tax=Petromyces alliaceus TaxID=209559 RepID=UPI0012A42368|nr:uncharacterized protein BDW43DRAFT_239011 [Aspergillus alliaceus]KAB8227664.1 hypothetical protein BDW43DRAFT_239011 [Aspergillus alliaceus]